MNYRSLEQKFYEIRKKQLDLHGRELTEMDEKVSKVMLTTVLRAIENVRSGEKRTWMQAVSLSTGLGKSTTSYALIAMLAKEDPEFSTAYVVPTAKMAMEAQKGIEVLLGEYTTLLWSQHHKDKGVNKAKTLRELGEIPERTANKAKLRSERIVIVTHAQLLHELRTGKDEGTLKYQDRPRSVVFIDEHPELLETVQATAERLQGFHDHLVKSHPHHPWLPIVSHVVMKMSEVARSNCQQYLPVQLLSPEQGKAFDDDAGLNLWELTDDELAHDGRLEEYREMREAVLFLRAASKGNAFYSRKNFAFFAYQLYLHNDYGGFVLLDATSDLLGLVALHPNVEFVEVPQVNYENLDLYHVAMPGKFRRMKDLLKIAATSREYVEFIKHTVLANSAPGDQVLVVVHKELITQERIDASEDPEKALDWEGRKVNTQNWGAGVGLNKFKHKTHVFLFGDYILPRFAVIARTHGWSQKPLNEDDLELAVSRRWRGDVYTPVGQYREPHEGHILRWTKQLAMRGCARQVDGEGRCLPMKLFTTMDLCRLTPNLPRLFPNAKPPKPANTTQDKEVTPVQGRQALLQLVMSTQNTVLLGADEIEVVTGIPSSKLTREYNAMKENFMALGWSIKAASEINLRGRMRYLVNEQRTTM